MRRNFLKIYLIIGFLCFTQSYAILYKKPTIISFENLESQYIVRDINNQQNYFLEKLKSISPSRYNNGIAFFIPNFLKEISLNVSSMVINVGVDGYIGKYNSQFDLGHPQQANQCFLEENIDSAECFLQNINNNQIILFLSPMPSIRVGTQDPNFFNNHSNVQNSWIYFYPYTKRDFIEQRRGQIFQYPQPIKSSFSFYFDKNKIDNFVDNHSDKVAPYKEKCLNPLIYLQKDSFDRTIQEIEQITNETFQKSSDFENFNNIENYVDTNLTALKKQFPQIGSKINYLDYLLTSAQKRADTTHKLCLYLNYTLHTPQYQNFKTATIINSNAVAGSIDDLYEFFHKINGYTLDGYFVKDQNEKYFISLDKQNIYRITKECKIKSENKVQNFRRKERILNLLPSNQTQQKYLIFMDDWDNDANDTTDCLLYSSSKLSKAVVNSNGNISFQELDTTKIGKIERAILYKSRDKIYYDNIIYFNKNSTFNTSGKESQSSFSSLSSSSSSSSSLTPSISSSKAFNESSSEISSIESSSSSNSSVSSSEASSVSSSSLPTFPGGNESGGFGENSISSSSSNSSVNLSGDSSSSVISSNIDSNTTSSDISSTASDTDSNETNKLLVKLANKSWAIEGYWIHYDQNDPFGWIYISKTGKTIAKLEKGCDPDGSPRWKTLQSPKETKKFSFIKIENGKIIIGPLNDMP